MYRLYSTGPIENANLTGTVSSSIIVKLLNNNINQNAEVEVKVFGLDGTKTQVFIETIQINPHSSEFRIIDVSTLLQFEVQIRVISNPYYVLIAVFGRDVNGELVAAQRVLHSELTEISLPNPCCNASFFQNYQ
ncbi:hypothetical protein [Clostridium sp.]